MTEKIKARLPGVVNVLHNLRTGKVSIVHDGEPIGTELPECKMSLDWYLEGADLLFKSGSDSVTLNLSHQSQGELHLFIIVYRKIYDESVNSSLPAGALPNLQQQNNPEKQNIYHWRSYTTQQCCEGLKTEVDAKLVEAYRKRIAEKEEQK